MSRTYRMPSLGSDMESATLIEWCKRPGDRLAKGDVIAVVETRKGAIEVEVFHDALMGRQLIDVGETVPVGAPMAALFAKAVALILRRFPELNGFDRNGRFEPAAAIHVGSAIAIRGGGLVAPAIHDADQLAVEQLMERLRDLVARVRAGGLRASELSDPTVTVSSLGERGVDRLYGVIYPPQVAIVGFGTPNLRPWVVDGEIIPRTLVTATLAADHRYSDGHRGALFLAKLAERLQEPDNL